MPEPTTRTVLIADNDTAVNGLFAEFVRMHGGDPEQAFDGEAARARLGTAGVALFVCDLDMPRLGGMEVLAWLAEQEEPPPTLVVSGYLDGETERRLGEFPFVKAALRKPFDLNEFGELIGQWLGAGGGEGRA